MVETRRLFLGYGVDAPWPDRLPDGRILAKEVRHVTTAFLGSVDYDLLRASLLDLPAVPFALAPVGVFDHCLFLPTAKRPNVVAWHVHWVTQAVRILEHVAEQQMFLEERGLYTIDRRGWLPHVTLCRKPKKPEEWESSFRPLPVMVTGFFLYESLGYSEYRKIWETTLRPPFEPLDHTADIAFRVKASDSGQMLRHASAALAFSFPEVTPFIEWDRDAASLDDVVVALNDLVGRVDMEIGSPCKAVSYHGSMEQGKDDQYTWEMIVDV